MNRVQKKRSRRVMQAGVILLGLLYAVPFYILILVSLKPVTDLSSYWTPPLAPTLENFANAWNKAHLGRAFLNNVIITAVVLLVVVLVGAIASYPLARFKTKWNNFIYTLFVSCMVVPPLTAMVPLYRLIADTFGTSTYAGIIFPHIAFQLPMTIFLYTGFITSIPRELDEAAMIDGASRFTLFYRILFPLLKPITATVVIMVGVQIWNDYTFSLFFLQKPEMKTITTSLSMFFSQYSNNVSWVAAGCIMCALPLVVVYLALQQYFVKGLSSGAVKG